MGEKPRTRSVFVPGEARWNEAAEAFGRRLRELRGNRKQADIAAAAGISRVYLSTLEAGKRPRPSYEVLHQLALVLGIELLDAFAEPPAQPDPADAGRALAVDTGERKGTVGSHADPVARPPEGVERAPEPSPPAPAPIHNAVLVPSSPGGNAPNVRVYRSGTRGDPRRPQEAPMPTAMERIPWGKEAIVGEHPFIVQFRGERLGGWHLRDGDLCWINPDYPLRPGILVAAEVETEEGDSGIGIYEWDVDDQTGPEGRLYYRPDRNSPPVEVPARAFTIQGPVVGVQSWRSPDEARVRCRSRLAPPPMPPMAPPTRPPPGPPRVNAPPAPVDPTLEAVLLEVLLEGKHRPGGVGHGAAQP